MKELFPTNTTVYNVSIPTDKVEKGKVVCRRRTIKGAPDNEAWHKHFAGEEILGLVPICDDGTTTWGCLDIDDPKIAIERVWERAEGMPIYPCVSKSGCVHVFVFYERPLAPAQVRADLDALRDHLKLPKRHVEIFPKQEKITASGTASPIAIPYGYQNSQCFRGEYLTQAQFVTQVERVVAIATDVKVPSYITMAEALFQKDGTEYDEWRKTSCAMKDWGHAIGSDAVAYSLWDKWCQFNDSYDREKNWQEWGRMAPAASDSDVSWRYLVSMGMSGVDISNLIKYNTQPPTYTVEINGKAVPCTSHELRNANELARLAFEYADFVMTPPKKETHNMMLRDLLANMVTKEAPVDASKEGMFLSLVGAFCTRQGTKKTLDAVLDGGVYVDGDRTYFEASELMRYLKSRGFTGLSGTDQWSALERHRNASVYIHDNGSVHQLWVIDSFRSDEEFDV